MPEHDGNTIQMLPAAEIRTDLRVQRQLVKRRVEEIKRTFRPSAVGVVTVSKRDDGKVYVIDGQHRLAAMRELGQLHQLVQCNVHEGLTVAEEADLFVRLNNTAKPKRIERFLKSVTAGDPDACAITSIVEMSGFRVDPQLSPISIRAVEALERIYQGDSRLSKERHPDKLRITLEILAKAWGYQHPLDGQVIHGVGLFVLRYDQIDVEALTHKLMVEAGGPPALLGKARTFRTVHGGSVASNVAGVITEIYNRGRRSRALPDWWSKH